MENRSFRNEAIFNDNSIDKKNNVPEIAEYSSMISANGQQINVSLQQSLLQNGTPLIKIANVSNSLNNTFSIACPRDKNFNSTFVNMSISSIYAPNKTLLLERDGFSGSDQLDLNYPYVTSFKVLGNGYIENISVEVEDFSGGGSPGTIHVWLYNSTFSSPYYRPGCAYDKGTEIGTFPLDPDALLDWYGNSVPFHAFLNSSKTTDNVWFIGLTATDGALAYWGYTRDDGAGDSDDESDAYNSPVGVWSASPLNRDFHLRVRLTPASNNPNPRDIGLKINSTLVTGYSNINGSGYWTTLQKLGSASGKLNFTVSANWWNVACNISKVLFNYTKTGFKAFSSFKIYNTGFDAIWNVSITEKINNFDARFNYYTINFTLPVIWHNIRAFNGTTEKTNIDLNGPPKNGFKAIRVLNAGNGTNWYLLTNSSNLLKNINIYLDGTPTTQASYSNTVRFNAIFSEKITQDKNLINLSIYNPLGSDLLNYTHVNNTFPSATSIPLGSWNISQTIPTTAAGNFRVQVYWYNDTAVGFNETILTIIPEANTAIIDITKNYTGVNRLIRGQNITYTFNYSDTDLNVGIKFANISELYIASGFTSFSKHDADGNYTIMLDTDTVDVSQSPFEYKIRISKLGYKPQTITLNIEVILTQVKISVISFNDTLYRKDNPTQTIKIYVNDTVNNNSVLGLKTKNVNVSQYISAENHPMWANNWTLEDQTGGNYSLKVKINKNSYDAGQYTLLINITNYPNYNWSVTLVTFDLIGNASIIHMVYVNYTNGLRIIPNINNYTIFDGNNLNLVFNITDNDYANALVVEYTPPLTYVLGYININTSTSGYMNGQMTFDLNTKRYQISNAAFSSLSVGNYSANITVTLKNYQVELFEFNLTIIARYQVRISVEEQPSEVDAGDSFEIILKVEYNNGSEWTPLIGATVNITVYINGKQSSESITKTTGSNGTITIEITLPSDAEELKLVVEVESLYNTMSSSLEIADIKVNPTKGNGNGDGEGLTWEVLLPYIIAILAIVAVVSGSILAYRKIVVPKKREKERIYAECKTMFEDAISLEHILVLYKGTGTCIFFKSFGTEGIDPELISGFLTAVSSFGKEMESQQTLNEITYGDKMLLLADGEFTRVALVLGKKASIILSKHLKEFIEAFEKAYTNELPNWKGQIDIFKNAGQIVDEKLNTSIILPHEMALEASAIKALKDPHSRDVLKIAKGLVESSERKFFFIATLLTEATEKLGKDTAEVFMGIKELREQKILKPIQISAIEEQPVSQQELNIIAQKVSQIPDIADEERQYIISELAQMGPAEREAYLLSLTKHQEIVSAPIKGKGGAAVIESGKSARKEVNNLKKNANKAIKEKNYQKAIEIFKNAAMIATGWDLNKEFEELQDTIRTTTIDELRIKMNDYEKEAKALAKEEKFPEAAKKYKQASECASEIFKLGVTDMTKEVKRLSNKSKEYEKLR